MVGRLKPEVGVMYEIECLVSNPSYGSQWIVDCKFDAENVVGVVYDDGLIGNPYMPDDYQGEWVGFWERKTAVRKSVRNIR